MAAVLDGVKVIEVAGWTFVPTGGAVLGSPSRICARSIRRSSFSPSPVRPGRPCSGLPSAPPELTRAPDAGEHTDEILDQELGLDWDSIIQLKVNNTIN